MHKLSLRELIVSALLLCPAAAAAQTVESRAIARDLFTDRPFPGEAARGVIVPPQTIVQESIQERIVRERLAPVVERTVVERPVVPERGVVTPSVAPWNISARTRYGYYNDAYFDDNWFYDYYDPPHANRGAGIPGFLTGWFYDPVAERGLLSF